MIKEFEYMGTWWLPNKSEKQVLGILKFTPDEGAILNLVGSFKDIKNIAETLEPDIILGVSSDGEHITLYKCHETMSTFSIPGLHTSSSFYIDMVFKGAHFQKPEDIKFKNIFIRFSHLDEWVDICGFDVKYLPGEQSLIIRDNLLEPFQTDISEGLKISINLQAERQLPSFVQKEVHIKQRVDIQIKTSEGKSFEDYQKIIYHIQNFLSLAVMEPVYPLSIVGITETKRKMVKEFRALTP